MTELTEVEKQVFAKIHNDTHAQLRLRAQIRKKHFLEESHQSSLEEFENHGGRGGKGIVRDAQERRTERDKTS